MEDVNWDRLLPRHVWTTRNAKCWVDLMPAPSSQLAHLLPKNFEGSCILHAYSETLTVILRGLVKSNHICVDLAKLLQMCVENGVLRATGTTAERLKKYVNSNGAIPLQGSLPDHLVGKARDKVEDPLANISVMGSELYQVKAKPLPFGTPTSEQATDAMDYRELLCSILDDRPVIICFAIQKHYKKQQDQGVPYRLLEGEHHYMKRNRPTRPWWDVGRYLDLLSSKGVGERLYHCVTAYAYDCPGGDVRTMRIHYQENAIIASDNQPGRIHPDAIEQPGRYVIHPDSIDCYFVPFVDEVYFRNTPNGH